MTNEQIQNISFKELRILSGLTQQKLATLVGVSRNSIHAAERKKLAKNSYIYKRIYDTLEIYL